MISEQQKALARRFQELHKQRQMFVLPNAWNAGSAYVFEKQGFAAVGTSSAGMAYDLGHADGEAMDFDELLWSVARMSKRLSVPLSVDFERGYGRTGPEVAANARALLEAGAVGFNLEDGLPDGGLTPLEAQVAKIAALAQLKRELDLNFVINARTCVYWLDVVGDDKKLRLARERGNAFAVAGADCIFVPGAMDAATVANLVAGINAPVNIILNTQFHDFAQLEKLGGRRLSIGSSLVRRLYGEMIALTDNLRHGRTDELLNTDFTYGRANAFFAKR